jgi:hypothetical protein
MATKIEAAQAYIDAVRTGVPALGKAARPHLADNIVVSAGPNKIEGADEAERRITGVWPNTAVMRKGSWRAPVEEDGKVKVHASMPPFGAGIQAVDFTFSFNDQNQITEVVQQNINNVPSYETDSLPKFVMDRVNNALFDDIPLTVAYTDEEGRPSLSLRGSVIAISPTQLALWARTKGGIVRAMERNPNISMLYRHNPERATLVFEGKGRVVQDQEEAWKIHDATPEVEINHLSRDTGAAIIIELENVDGSTPEGRVKFRRKLD